jgi:hypothetical protein
MRLRFPTTPVPAALAFAALAFGAFAAQAQSLSSSGVRAVTTYEAAGLYWTNPGASAATGCDVRYRKAGDTTWSTGLAMWFDASANECRGSLVGLTPGTHYEAQLGLSGTTTHGITFTTWTNRIPVAKTVTVASGSGTFNVAEGGSASGYVVYDGGGAVLDAHNTSPYNVTINASHVIVRGLNLRGAQQHAILISPNVHDVIIEDNDISGWGRTRDGTWGTDMDSGIRAICKSEELTRVTIQRNRIHDPRYSANSWTDGHPAGPQGITFSYCGGNHVIRWNEIYSTSGNRFNDGMGGEDNFSTTGFPNADSDIYGNKISYTWDDAIEAEGGNRNVRIWGNYLDRTATGIATTVTSVGPVYIFRNVYNRNQFYDKRASDQDDRQPFFKSGSSSDFNNGRRYLFHNTMLQGSQSGVSYGLGGGAGVGGTGDSQLVHNTVSMNNIYHLWKANSAVYQVASDNVFQNDMFNGNMGTGVVSGINATPRYAAGSGWQSEAGGMYQLAAGTPGHDGGVRIPNFNDAYVGAAPDVGAAEAGGPAMTFGIAASTGNSGGTATPVIPVTPVIPTTPSTTPTTPAGSATPSLGIDSSSYRINAGEGVTFTVSVSGNSGTPTGKVAFRSNGSPIAGCDAVALSNGTAACNTNGLSGGANVIMGVYSGDARYGAGQAGPITQTVSGTAVSRSLPTSFGIDSSSYTVAAGQSVTFTATIPGDGGTMQFQADGAAIGGCGAVAVAQGTALCTTSALSAGTHAIRGYYSGYGAYSGGIAGPITQTVTAATTSGNPAINVQGLWWGSASESGWGLNLTQQGSIIFATWFTYDAAGNGQWLVMSNGQKTGDNTYAGTLYRTTGPAFSDSGFDPSRVVGIPVGSASLAFSDANNGTFTASVDGVTVAKAITRQVYGAQLPTCVAGGSAGTSPNYQDLWWRPEGAESGWGVNLTHQGDILFMTWFTYDANGKGMWLVASNVAKTSNGHYAGTLYRTTGPAFNAAKWDAARVNVSVVGAVSFSFGDANNGVFTYTVNGVTQSKPITRQVFSTPATVCR